jgi:zinc-ribbon domain
VKLFRSPSTTAAPGTAAPGTTSPAPEPVAPGAELVTQRERLTERFALLQSELGGLFYEMAIRDHVKMDVLIDKAAALQRVDAELAQVEHLLDEGHQTAGGQCPNCGAPHARGAAFCSQCAAVLNGGS